MLDPVATVMLDVIDGEASIGQLATEVHEEVGVPFDVALQQVGRTVQLFDAAGMLTSSVVAARRRKPSPRRQLFVNPPNP